MQVFGSSGYVDFWIGLSETTGWAIELLRDGDRRREHVERFVPGGSYSSLPYTRHAVIDFSRKANNSISCLELPDTVYYVTFSEDFTEATLKCGPTVDKLYLHA
jgi:hypothetical protein